MERQFVVAGRGRVSSLPHFRNPPLSFFRRNHIDPAPTLVEQDGPLDQRENRPIPTDADVLAGMPPRSALAAEDAAGLRMLAAKKFDAQHLWIRVAAIAAGALSLFMSHETIVPLRAVQT
jgi:hypothetical protein